MWDHRYMAGKCASGANRDAGPRWHAVPKDAGFVGKALCGRGPSIQWSDPNPEKPVVTCPKCLARLKRLEKQHAPTG